MQPASRLIESESVQPGAAGASVPERAPGLTVRGSTLSYAESESVEAGLKFKTRSGLIVETTGVTLFVDSTDVYAHEVEIQEGVGEGNRYYHNLDAAEPIEE